MEKYWNEMIQLEGRSGKVSVKYLKPSKTRFKPIVLVHGWAATSDIWYFVATRLQEYGFPVYAIDLPGHGISDHPENVEYGLPLMLEYLKQLMDVIDEPVILCGHSMGGAISMNYTLTYPQDVSSLVLVSTAARFWEIVPEVIAHIFPERFIDISKETIIKFYSSRWQWESFLEKKRQLDLLESSFNTGVHVLKSTYQHIIRKWDKRDEIHKITQRTLLFVGTNDMITPKRGMEFLLQTIPLSMLKTFQGVSHQLPIEKGRELASILTAYGVAL